MRPAAGGRDSGQRPAPGLLEWCGDSPCRRRSTLEWSGSTVEPARAAVAKGWLLPMTSTDRTRPRRRWRSAALADRPDRGGRRCSLALPQLLSRTLSLDASSPPGPGSSWRPARWTAAAVRVSWFGPTEIDGAVLRDDRGDRLIAADRAVVDWNLWQILFARPETATLELPGAEVDDRAARRRPDRPVRDAQADHPRAARHRLVVAIDGRPAAVPATRRWPSPSWPTAPISGSTSPAIPSPSSGTSCSGTTPGPARSRRRPDRVQGQRPPAG